MSILLELINSNSKPNWILEIFKIARLSEHKNPFRLAWLHPKSYKSKVNKSFIYKITHGIFEILKKIINKSFRNLKMTEEIYRMKERIF